MIDAKFDYHRTNGSVGEDFEGFNHIWVWRPSRSWDLDHLKLLSSPPR